MSAELPQRLPETDYPSLAALLDDVVTLGFWVQRATLPWVPGTPDKEHLSLYWLERNLEDLERAAKVAGQKVAWRRRMAEASADRERAASVQAGLDAGWEESA